MAASPGTRWGAAAVRGLIGVLALVLVLDGCSRAQDTATTPTTSPVSATSTTSAPTTSSTTEPVTTTTWPASFGVGIRTITLVDTTRSTQNFATSPPSLLSRDRVLNTQIRYPTLSSSAGGEQLRATPASAFGPFPVIVFAHGYAVMPNTYEYLLDAWVRAGFVVVSPIFPVSNYYEWMRQGGGPAPESDMGNQPADVAFVIGQLAKLETRAGWFLHGLLDLRHLGLAGQSDGATTVGGLVFASYWRGYFASMPFHPLAVAILSGAAFQGAGDYAARKTPDPAILSVESDDDYCNPTENATELYDAVAPGTPEHWFLTLHGADHLGPYVGQPPWATAVADVTIDFFELELSARLRERLGITSSDMARAGDVAGVASITGSASVSLPETEAAGDCGSPTPYDPYPVG